MVFVFFFSSRRRHTRCGRDWSSDVCSSDLHGHGAVGGLLLLAACLTTAAPAVAEIIYVYDNLSRLVGVVDPAGDTVVSSYDSVGNLLSISRYASSTVSVIEFSPHSGPVGATVTISGTGFSATPSQNVVSFNGTPTTVTSSTATQIVATVPAAASTGPISVTTPTGSASSSAPFTVTSASGPPTITGLSPPIAAAGTAVTITGTNFATTPALDKVIFNAAALTTASSATPTTIGANVPDAAGSGKISVSTPTGKAVSASDFFIPPPPYTAASVEVTGRISLGGSQTVTITSVGKIALLVFDAAAGQRAAIGMTGVTIASSTVTVYNPAAGVLTSTSVNSSGATLDLIFPFTGTYTIL